MEGKTKNKVDFELGCGMVGRIFNLKTNNRTRKSSVHSLPVKVCNTAQQRSQAKNASKPHPNHESKVPRESSIGAISTLKGEKNQNPVRKSSSNHQTILSAYQNTQNERASDAARTSIRQSHDSNEEGKQQQKEHIGNCLVLARISTSTCYHQNYEIKSLVKEFVLPITGNLLMNSSSKTSVTKNKELNSLSGSCAYNGNANKSVMGNITRKNSNELLQFRSPRNNRGETFKN